MGMGRSRVIFETERHIKILGTIIRSVHTRPIRVKNLTDGSQYLLVQSHHLTLDTYDPIFEGLWVEEQVKLYKFKLGLDNDLSNVHLSDCEISFSLKGARLTGSTFKNVDFVGSNLEGADLRGSTFIGCTLTDMNIKGAVFSESKLEDVNFTGSDLSGSYFYDADFHAPIMRGSNLTGVRLEKASFNGGDFTGANLEGVDFTDMEYSLDESESDCMNGYLPEPRLIFNNANLKGAKFDGTCLNHAQFEGADLTGTSFKGCDLSSEYPIDCVYSEGTSFKGATLESTDFEGANLSGVLSLRGFF
jgi:uncharacterized protein YjbI with pentapeptide repeats